MTAISRDGRGPAAPRRGGADPVIDLADANVADANVADANVADANLADNVEPACSVIELRNGRKAFSGPGGDVEPLRDVSISVRQGESVAVMGRSGSGKSTLLRVLGLLTPLTAGEYRFKGRPANQVPDALCSHWRAKHIGFVFQDFRLLPNLTAAANVEYGAAMAGAGRRDRKRLSREMLRAVGVEDRGAARPQTLSGGEQQRVSIARALVKSPALVLADEPTGALDEETAADVMALLLDATRNKQAALVVVTHDRDIAAQCDRLLVLRSGVAMEATA